MRMRNHIRRSAHDAETKKSSTSTTTTASSSDMSAVVVPPPLPPPPPSQDDDTAQIYPIGSVLSSGSKPSRREQLAKIRFHTGKKSGHRNSTDGKPDGEGVVPTKNGLPPASHGRRSVMKSMKKVLAVRKSKAKYDPVEEHEVKGLRFLEEDQKQQVSSEPQHPESAPVPVRDKEAIELEHIPSPFPTQGELSAEGIERVLTDGQRYEGPADDSGDLLTGDTGDDRLNISDHAVLSEKSVQSSSNHASSSLPPPAPPATKVQTPPQIPAAWQKRQYSEQMRQWHQHEMATLEYERAGQRRQLRERDGFCRRVDSYDGQIITVDGKPTYELGNYLGGGVAGVVYEGFRLRPIHEYPIRNGLIDKRDSLESPTPSRRGFLSSRDNSFAETPGIRQDYSQSSAAVEMDVAIEIPAASTRSFFGAKPVLDSIDAPSRSQHAARAASRSATFEVGVTTPKIVDGVEETVAVKILNPVGFRLLQPSAAQNSVVVKKGEVMSDEVKRGLCPMEEKHVWWLVNPNSRNLRTLLKQPSALTSENGIGGKSGGRKLSGDIVDRGTPDRGLRLSLVAAYIDPKTDMLRELPLTRCIEIWGHAPFGASESEFEEMMDAIERVNAGHPPATRSSSNPNILVDSTPSRVTTGTTESTGLSNGSYYKQVGSNRSSPPYPNHQRKFNTGLSRAAASKRSVVYCSTLNAHIAVPAVPPKFLRWLRQRRAATKEIRNMMRIGRHRNVVHLYEVLELIQDSKSTMFLILELVKGGELFDLISSNSTSPNNLSRRLNHPTTWDETEVLMLKFFRELTSGISYCHANGIAHRDLKPENLLVQNGPGDDCTLKIADFGLSAAFALSHHSDNGISDLGSRTISLLSFSNTPGDICYTMSRSGSVETSSQRRNYPPKTPTTTSSPGPVTGLSPLFRNMNGINMNGISMNGISQLGQLGASALSFLTCGATLDNTCSSVELIKEAPPEPLRRMTSIVGSPHYVAPEIISQTDNDDGNNNSVNNNSVSNVGYDGTKADVWSAGVILYAMLFRSLPFGEDLLRCPRYQSYNRWYKDARKLGGRRCTAAAALVDDFNDPDMEETLGPHWFFPAESSMESRDLIVAMLNPDPFQRLSIQQILMHPWLVKRTRTRGKSDNG